MKNVVSYNLRSAFITELYLEEMFFLQGISAFSKDDGTIVHSKGNISGYKLFQSMSP